METGSMAYTGKSGRWTEGGKGCFRVGRFEGLRQVSPRSKIAGVIDGIRDAEVAKGRGESAFIESSYSFLLFHGSRVTVNRGVQGLREITVSGR